MTRGLAEITRLAVALGGEAATLAGLAGLGDLVLTATGTLSRNRALGMALARGESRVEAQRATRMVAEGVPTVASALALAARHGVALPICGRGGGRAVRGKVAGRRRSPRCWGARRHGRMHGWGSVVPELRKDPVVGRWVIISTERGRRPSDFPRQPVEAAGRQLRVLPEQRGRRRRRRSWPAAAPTPTPTGPGWSMRVVPNKFPALRIEGELEPSGEGLYDRMNGVGAHEVVIETPDHTATLATLPTEAVADVLAAYRERVLDLKKDPRFAYILVFKNHGAAAGRLARAPALPAHRHARSSRSWSRRS